MNNVLDYIRWRGDLSFAQDPLNAVDAVIFSNLVYIRYPDEEKNGETKQKTVDTPGSVL